MKVSNLVLIDIFWEKVWTNYQKKGFCGFLKNFNDPLEVLHEIQGICGPLNGKAGFIQFLALKNETKLQN